MSESTSSFERGKGLRILTTEEESRMIEAIAFIRKFASTRYTQAPALDKTKIVLVNGMAQPGLCANWSNISTKIFLKPQLKELIPEEMMTGATVLINVSSPDSGGTLWPPVLFHECGHAMFDTKAGPQEPCAWRVELEASFAWVQEHSDEKQKFKLFVQERKKAGMYASFPSDGESSARSALSSLQ